MKGEVFFNGEKVADATDIVIDDVMDRTSNTYAADDHVDPVRWPSGGPDAKPFTLDDIRQAVNAIPLPNLNRFFGKVALELRKVRLFLPEPEAIGASTATLMRRAKYGGKKGRKAARRLRPLFKAAMRAQEALATMTDGTEFEL
jgi:hypothetical protein